MQTNFFAENISDDSSLWRRFAIMCQARKKIKFHRCSFQNINKFVQKPKLFFLVIFKVCWTVCVFHFLNLDSLKRIYASPFTFRDFRNRCTMKLLKVEQTLKSWKGTPQRVNAFFTKLLSKMWTDNVVKTIYCQRNLIFLWQKNYSIHYLTGQNRGLSGLQNIWPVITTGDLLSVIFSPEYKVALHLPYS